MSCFDSEILLPLKINLHSGVLRREPDFLMGKAEG